MDARLATQNASLEELIPDYSFRTRLEENFDYNAKIEWFNDYLHAPYAIVAGLYLPILYFGQRLMADRKPFRLRAPLIVWNGGLAVFSILGFARLLPELLHTLNKFGFQHTICNRSFLHSNTTCFWLYLFTLSKVLELMDTVFLVLKKQRLIFLHVYHHATVLIFAWTLSANQVAVSRWFSTMNFGVHSIMYSYYALKAFPQLVRIPKSVSMLITSLQTAQMIMGTYVVATAFRTKLSGQECAITTNLTAAGLAIYVSYLFLFAHFFYSAYLSPSRGPRATDKKRA